MQVGIANARFAPDDQELLEAGRLVAAWELAQATEKSFDGGALDMPVAERARRLLERRRAHLCLPRLGAALLSRRPSSSAPVVAALMVAPLSAKRRRPGALQLSVS
jgi:hypothetical protein